MCNINVFCTGLLAVASLNADILFQRERIDATIIALDTLEIQATYWFLNNNTFPEQMAVYYPFPVDTISFYPHLIVVNDLSRNRRVRFDTLPEGVLWSIHLAPKTVDSFLVIYRQALRRPEGRYILTTTKAWGKPLQYAKFRVIVPRRIVLDYWTFPIDSVYSAGSSVIYSAHFKSFRPNVDMRLRWHCE